MSNFQTWYKKSINLKAGQLYTYNLKTESNIIQVFNKVASGGSTVFLDDTDKVSPTFFSVEVQQGKNASLVKPYVLETVYLYVESDVTVDVIEIKSEDLSFMFTASQVVDVQGSVQVQEPVTVDGTVQISGETEITNDSGTPIPVSGNVNAQVTGSNKQNTILESVTVKAGSTVYEHITATGSALGVSSRLDTSTDFSIELRPNLEGGNVAAGDNISLVNKTGSDRGSGRADLHSNQNTLFFHNNGSTDIIIDGITVTNFN